MEPTINKESIFNEAYLKVQRIDTSWRTVNILRTNLLDWNPEYKKWNFEIVISELFSSALETRGKMSDKEKGEFNTLRVEILNDIENKKVYIRTTVNGIVGNRKVLKFNKDNWDELRKKIFALEDFCRDQQEKHGLSTPSKRDPTKASIDL